MDTDAQSLWRAKDDAVTLRKAYSALQRERILKWVGNKYSTDWKTKSQLENYSAGYIAFMLAQMVMADPVVDVTPRSDPRDTASAEGTASLINDWIVCANYKRDVIEPCATNMLLGFGVTYKCIDLTMPEAEQGMPVSCQVIPNGDYFCDSQCFGYARRRFEGHSFEKTKAELQADPRYMSQAALIEQLQPNDADKERDDVPAGGDRGGIDTKRDVITLWQFYLRQTGEIVTLVQNGGGAAELRREPYEGPRCGPYTLWGCYDVPGQIYPLSPLASVEEQSDDLQLHANAASKNARKYKKVGIYNKANTADGTEFQKSVNGDFIGLADANSVKELEVGGPGEIQFRVLEQLKGRMDSNLGFSSAQRGIATGKATLGENQLAQGNSDAKTSYIAGRLRACVEEDLRSVGWFMYNSPDVIKSLAIENPQTGQSEPVQYYGGQFQEAEIEALVAQGMVDPSAIYSVGKDWTDYHLSIQVESMQRVADPIRQKRGQDEIALAMSFYQMLAAAIGPVPALQSINWRRLLRRLGQAFNVAKYDQVFLTGAFGQLFVDPLAMGQMGQQPGMMQGPSPAQPNTPTTMSSGPPQGPPQGFATQQGMAQNAMAGAGAF